MTSDMFTALLCTRRASYAGRGPDKLDNLHYPPRTLHSPT